MSWMLPPPILVFAGAVALWAFAAVVRRPPSLPRLVAKAFGTTLSIIGLVQLAWLALWVLEQRW